MLRRTWLLAAVATTALAGCAAFGGPSKNLADTLAGDPQFKTLASLMNDAGLTATLRDSGPFTVFAPTDAAFARLPAATIEAWHKDHTKLRHVLTYHMLGGEQTIGDLKAGDARTVNGAPLPLSRSGSRVLVDQALVTTADIKATNGVIHAIDQVLVPPARR